MSTPPQRAGEETRRPRPAWQQLDERSAGGIIDNPGINGMIQHRQANVAAMAASLPASPYR